MVNGRRHIINHARYRLPPLRFFKTGRSESTSACAFRIPAGRSFKPLTEHRRTAEAIKHHHLRLKPASGIHQPDPPLHTVHDGTAPGIRVREDRKSTRLNS